MFLFVGDSHSRQFQCDRPGRWGFVSFSGVTIKGLASPGSEHAAAIRHLAAIPIEKTLFIMLGAVDLDITYYRTIALGGDTELRPFLARRVEIYRSFLDDLAVGAGASLRHVCVLAPQLTPLRDEAFIPATAAMAKLSEEEMARAASRVDCSHRARCARQIAFNDLLGALSVEGSRSVHRIDRGMTVDGVLIADRFIPKRAREHHADPAATLPLWQADLQAFVPAYKRAVARRARIEAARANAVPPGSTASPRQA